MEKGKNDKVGGNARKRFRSPILIRAVSDHQVPKRTLIGQYAMSGKLRFIRRTGSTAVTTLSITLARSSAARESFARRFEQRSPVEEAIKLYEMKTKDDVT